MTNKITRLERQRDEHKGQANHLENAASRLMSQRTNIEHKRILFEGHYELGSRKMSSHSKTAYKAFLDAWHQLGPGLIRAAELDLMARARVEREKMRAIERQLAPIYAAVEELAGPEQEEDDG